MQPTNQKTDQEITITLNRKESKHIEQLFLSKLCDLDKDIQLDSSNKKETKEKMQTLIRLITIIQTFHKTKVAGGQTP